MARIIRAIVSGYTTADNPAEWQRQNPEQFKMIAMIERERRRVARLPKPPPFKQSVIGYIEQQRRIWQRR